MRNPIGHNAFKCVKSIQKRTSIIRKLHFLNHLVVVKELIKLPFPGNHAMKWFGKLKWYFEKIAEMAFRKVSLELPLFFLNISYFLCLIRLTQMMNKIESEAIESNLESISLMIYLSKLQYMYDREQINEVCVRLCTFVLSTD